MTTFQFPASKVKAALIFAASQDIRYYLNGVLFTKAPDGKGIMAVSTDGHRLAAIYHAQDVSELPDFSVIVPRDELATVTKSAAKESDLVFTLEQTRTTDTTGVEHVSPMAIEIRGAVSVKCNAVDGKFPDYQRVIPRKFGAIQVVEKGQPAAAYACIDSTYLGDYAKAAKALGSRYMGISFAQADGGASFLVNLFDQPDFVSVVMSMRGDAPAVPGWIDPPAADNVVKLRKAA